MHGSTGSGKKHGHQALNIHVFRLCQKRGAVALVNFPMRVTSNLKNGRYGQKMEDGQDNGQIMRDTRAGIMASSLLFVGASTFAADGEIKSDLKELHQDNREIHGDRRGSCTAISKSLKETVRSCAATSRAARATQRSPRIERKFAAVGERSKAIGTRSERITGNAAATNASCGAISAIVKRAIRLYF